MVDQFKFCVGRTSEGTEEYQRVTTNVGKGLTVIQQELHRMRMATKAQVDSLAIQREVRSPTFYQKHYVVLDLIMLFHLPCIVRFDKLSDNSQYLTTILNPQTEHSVSFTFHLLHVCR